MIIIKIICKSIKKIPVHLKRRRETARTLQQRVPFGAGLRGLRSSRVRSPDLLPASLQRPFIPCVSLTEFRARSPGGWGHLAARMWRGARVSARALRDGTGDGRPGVRLPPSRRASPSPCLAPPGGTPSLVLSAPANDGAASGPKP